MAVWIICIIIVACAMEFYKKALRGVTTDEGRKTKASRWEIYIVALILSAIVSFLYYEVEEYVNPWSYTLILASIYFLQYMVDMEVVKSFVNLAINRTADKE